MMFCNYPIAVSVNLHQSNGHTIRISMVFVLQFSKSFRCSIKRKEAKGILIFVQCMFCLYSTSFQSRARYLIGGDGPAGRNPKLFLGHLACESFGASKESLLWANPTVQST